MPTRTCWPRMIAIGWATALIRIAGPERDDRALRFALEPVHPVERIVAAPAAAVGGDVGVQRTHVGAVADQPLHDLELVDVRQREVGLDPAARSRFRCSR